MRVRGLEAIVNIIMPKTVRKKSKKKTEENNVINRGLSCSVFRGFWDECSVNNRRVVRLYTHTFIILVRSVIFHDVEIRSQLGAWAGGRPYACITYYCYRLIV